MAQVCFWSLNGENLKRYRYIASTNIKELSALTGELRDQLGPKVIPDYADELVLFNIWFKAHMRNCPGCHDRYQGEWLGSGPEYAAQLSLDGRSA